MESETYNTERWSAALNKFLTDATTLTDDDIAQLALTDSRLAERAQAARAGYTPTENESDKEFVSRPLPIGAFFNLMRDMVYPTLSTYRYKLHALEKRIVELETRPGPGGVSYGGAYDSTKRYPIGTLVQKHGLWLSLVDGPTKAPGNDHTAWKLVVKERGGGDDVLRERLERLERRLTLLEGRR